jgi:hypothetical protein
MKTRRGAVVAAVALALVVGGAAASGPDDRSTAETILKDVAASSKKDIAQEMAARARAALERGAKLRAAGDEPHARLADAAARSWAEAARDVLRAAEVEEKAAAARRAATDAGAVADRERALLEEGIAQTGRLRAQLEAASRETKEQPARTSTQAGAPEARDAGAKPSAPAKKPPQAPALDGGAR